MIISKKTPTFTQKFGRETCINWIETKCSVRQIITIMFVTYVQTDIYIRTLIKQLLTKY